MTAIPERLRKRAAELFAFVDKRDLGNGHQAIPYIATALHEIEQAARAEGERAGIERAAQVLDAKYAALAERSYPAPSILIELADRIRALPTTAEPAKGA